MPKKRTIDAFFGASNPKKQRVQLASTDEGKQDERHSTSSHATYPHPIANLSASLVQQLRTSSTPPHPGRLIADQPDLDLLYFEPLIPTATANSLFHFLRASLPFYRVKYTINRFGTPMHITTPRFTTVFGVDATAWFSSEEDLEIPPKLLSADTGSTKQPIPQSTYHPYNPRPIPSCLHHLQRLITAACSFSSPSPSSSCSSSLEPDPTFNFCLINYYASGADSISYHSDDERFLGPDPIIASLSLGGKRDFCMKRKPPPSSKTKTSTNSTAADYTFKQVKLPLASGDCIIMRGGTQANWLHSVPKRSGRIAEAEGDRINITFRKAMVKSGTKNYYHYNVGNGPVYRWDEGAGEMRIWKRNNKAEE